MLPIKQPNNVVLDDPSKKTSHKRKRKPKDYKLKGLISRFKLAPSQPSFRSEIKTNHQPKPKLEDLIGRFKLTPTQSSIQSRKQDVSPELAKSSCENKQKTEIVPSTYSQLPLQFEIWSSHQIESPLSETINSSCLVEEEVPANNNFCTQGDRVDSCSMFGIDNQMPLLRELNSILTDTPYSSRMNLTSSPTLFGHRFNAQEENTVASQSTIFNGEQNLNFSQNDDDSWLNWSANPRF